MAEFIPVVNGGARVVLDDAETDIIRGLTNELRTLLADGRVDRGDPVYERLFPSAYEDTKDEAAYRDLIGDDLLTHKLAALDAVSTALGPSESSSEITITDDALDAWLSCLTDLRLAIGVRIDVDEERMAAGFDRDDPDASSLAVLHWLGFVQESVLRACSTL